MYKFSIRLFKSFNILFFSSVLSSVTIRVLGIPGVQQRLGVDIAQLVHQSLISTNVLRYHHTIHYKLPDPPVGHPDVGDVGPLDAVSRHARPDVNKKKAIMIILA